MQYREMVRLGCALVVSSVVSGCGSEMVSTGGGPSSGTGGAGGDIGGASALVYTEATNPTVKLHASYMVTGS